MHSNIAQGGEKQQEIRVLKLESRDRVVRGGGKEGSGILRVGGGDNGKPEVQEQGKESREERRGKWYLTLQIRKKEGSDISLTHTLNS